MTATYLYYAKIKFILAIMSESIYDGRKKMDFAMMGKREISIFRCEWYILISFLQKANLGDYNVKWEKKMKK